MRAGMINTESTLPRLSLHATLTNKRKIFVSNAVVWNAVHLYTPYTFGLMCEAKEESKED